MAELHELRVQGRPDRIAILRRLLDAVHAEARHKPHTQEWCKARDAVTVAAMELADSIRKGEEQ